MLFFFSYIFRSIVSFRIPILNWLTYSFTALVFTSCVTSLNAQYKEFPIKNFTKKEYGASPSNWKITQDDLGVIYTANYDGIIGHDGLNWQFTPIKENLIGLSVAADFNNRIFVGTLGGFGYLKPNDSGELQYISLSENLPTHLQMSAFWDIVPTKRGTYFRSPFLIARWHNGKTFYWETNTKFLSINNVHDTIYVTQQDEGIMKIILDSLTLLPSSNTFAEKGIELIDKNNSNLLIGKYEDGFYTISQKKISRTPSNANPYIKSSHKFSSIKNPSSSRNRYILGTSGNGIITLDSLLEINTIINKSSGLVSNTVKNVSLDSHYNLWSAMDKGIAFTELSSPWSFWQNITERMGIPISILRYQKELYVGTSEGLFKISDRGIYKFPDIDNSVWDLCQIGSNLAVANQAGLFIIRNNKIIELFDFIGVNRLHTYRNLNLLLVGHSNGISLLELNNNKWEKKLTVNISNPAYVSIIRENNDIWVSAKFRGVYQISNSFTSNPMSIIKYDTTHGLPDVNEIQIVKKDQRLLFTTSRGFYYFDENDKIFKPDSSILKERLHINNIAEDHKGNYFISVVSSNRKSHIEMLKMNGKQYIRDSIPFKRLPEMGIHAIYPEKNGNIWFGGDEGIYQFNPNIKKDYTLPYNTLIRKVTMRDSLIFGGAYYDPADTTGVPPIIYDQPDIFKPELEYKNNNLTFEYSAAFYEAPERTVFSYYLEGNDPGWSKWSADTKQGYNNLSAGTYTFHVKAKNIYGTVGRTASYEFTILPPWYQTAWAYVLFAILAILFVWFVALVYTYRVRMHQRRLKLIVADRTYEVITQKKEIERQRDNIQITNQELQQAQEETLSANEALQQLNTHLEREVEKRTEKIKLTLQQLQNKNKELDTFIYRASHDLKGPVSRISGLSSLAKMATPQDGNQEFVELIEVTANNMKVLISKLTQVHDLNNTRIQKDKIDLQGLLGTIRGSLRHLETEANVNYTFNINDQQPLVTDVNLLGIILQNLLENALVFRKPRSTEHHITIEIDVSEDHLLLKVADTGMGIYPKHQDRLFDMFFKGVNESIGSGLGLYLVKMAVERLNGTIHVNSQLHEFSEFIVDIPLTSQP